MARQLRSQGMSIKKIAYEVSISKGTVSNWCRDIQLTQAQIETLLQDQSDGGTPGRLKGANSRKERRLNQINTLKEEGVKCLSSISERDLLLAGLGIYWGEGYKTGSLAGFANSDPDLIKFMIYWFQIAFSIPLSELRFQIGIDESYNTDTDIERVQKFWYSVTGALPEQFNNISYKRIRSKKIYPNPQDHYGTLRIRVTRSSYTHRKILGLIEGLKATTIVNNKAA